MIRQVQKTGDRFNRAQLKQTSTVSKKIHGDWKRKWYDSETIERVIFNNKNLEESKQKTLCKPLERIIKKEQTEWKKVEKQYTNAYINRLNLSITAGRIYAKIGKDKKQRHEESIKIKKLRLEAFVKMSLEDYYQSLNDAQKFKLINMKTISFTDADTMIGTEINSVIDDE